MEAATLCAAMLRQPESWVHRAINPDWQWADPGLAALADARDFLAMLWWAKTKDAEKNRNRPEPFPRPGVEVDTEDMPAAATIDVFDALLAQAKASVNG